MPGLLSPSCPFSAPLQGCGICDVLPAVPAGHLLPAVPLHRLLGQHGRVSTVRPRFLTPGMAKDHTRLEVTCSLGAGPKLGGGRDAFSQAPGVPNLRPQRFLNELPASCPLPMKLFIKSSGMSTPAQLMGKPAALRWVSRGWGGGGGGSGSSYFPSSPSRI